MTILERIAESESLIRWLDEKINGLSLSSDLRSRLAGGCLDVALEHQKGIVTLVSNQLYGSALALVRLIFEAYIRGVWLHQCADEDALNRFEKNKLEKKFGDLIAEIEKLDGFNNRVLSTAKKHSWQVMNSFTHTGFHQVVRRNTEATIEPDYDEGEILEALDFANVIAVLAVIEIAHLGSNEVLASEIFQRAKNTLARQP